MANVHAPHKETLSIYIPRTLLRRVRKKALSRGQTLTEHLVELLENATQGVRLTEQDRKEIEEATRLAIERRKRVATQAPPRPGAGRKAQ